MFLEYLALIPVFTEIPIKEAPQPWWRGTHKRDPAKKAAATKRRDAYKLKAIPGWANMREIEKFYDVARQKTSETGVVHHVDHIIPLKGKTVCGLHWEGNLRVITQSENCQKSAKVLLF